MKHLLIIFAMTIVIHNICMEIDVPQSVKKNPNNFVDLLENNGKYLKELIAVENNGFYSPDLYAAQETLQTCFAVNALQDVQISCDQKTLKLAQRIAQRDQAYQQVYNALAKYDFKQAETIISKNKYCLNYVHHGLLLSKTIDSSTAEFLIIFGANVHQKDIVGRTPLFDLIDSKDISSLLLQYGARINETDDDGNTILHETLKSNLRLQSLKTRYFCNPDEGIDFLLSKGANPEICNKKGETPLDIVCKDNAPFSWKKIFIKYGYLFFSQIKRPWNNPYMLLKDNAAYLKKLVNTSETVQLYNAILRLIYLFEYCKRKDRSLEQCLSYKGIIVNQKICLFKGASLQDCNDFFGEQAIMYAQNIIKTRYNVKKDLKILLYKSAENSDIATLTTILDNVSINNKQWQAVVLCKLIANHDEKSLQCCLKHGFIPEVLIHNKYTPLVFAVQNNNVEAVKLLPDYGYDAYQIKDALEEAIFLEHKECAKILQDALQKCLIPALRRHSCDEVRMLITMDVDINKVNNKNKTPMHYATKSGCQSCIQLLTADKGLS